MTSPASSPNPSPSRTRNSDAEIAREITARDRSLAFLVFGFLLACYLFTYTGVIQSSDGLAMFSTAESIARRGALDSNQLLWMDLQQGSYGPDGNLYSRKGIGMVLLALPLVWIARLWGLVGLVQAALLLNPLLTAWTGALLFRAARRLDWTRNTAIATALIFGLGTLAWPYTQTFFSDPVCGWGLFAAAYGLLSYAQTGRKRYMAAAGLAWGLAYLARVINLVTLPIFLLGLILVLRRNLERREDHAPGFIETIRREWRPVISFLIPVAAAGLLSLWWNWARYGNFFSTGYAESERFDALWWFGIMGQIVGPARGLIWYSPVLLLAVPGAIWFWRNERRVFWLSGALVALYVLLYGKWYMWHGGYSWGPRFLVPLMPFLGLFAGAGWGKLVARREWGGIGKFGAFLLFALSIAVQWLGMLVPFGLVQDWLAEEVQPLFAPETFVRLDYSPLVAQWQFLDQNHVILAWWRATTVTGEMAWLGFLAPLFGMLIGLLLIRRQLSYADAPAEIDSPRNWLYGVALCIIALAILTYYQPYLSSSDNRAVAATIAQEEERDDAILHLVPQETQQFSTVYHGRKAAYGLFARGELDATDSYWMDRLHRDHRRIWVVPDYAPPEQSGWERSFRTEDFLLLDTRPAGDGGRRLALYALADAYEMEQVGLGTVFGDPDGETPVSDSNGWIRLDGFAVTTETTAGGELLLTLAWRSLQPVDKDYHVFVHLLNAEGTRLAQRDGQPVQWLRPTSTWEPGEEIIDRYGMLLADDLPSGQYHIDVGLYDPVTGQRLPVSAGPQDFAIEIGPISVEPPTGRR